jgi:hypothetical protein
MQSLMRAPQGCAFAPFKVDRVVTIRKLAELTRCARSSDRSLRVALSKKFRGTRQRIPRIWISTGVASKEEE